MTAPDPVALAQALIRCPSVTPDDAGAIGVLEAALKPLGFACHRLRFEAGRHRAGRKSLRADRNAGPEFLLCRPHRCRAAGRREAVAHDPFAAEIENGTLYGRGAADMKSAIAASWPPPRAIWQTASPYGSISLLITGDEEGLAINGTPKMLGWLKEHGETLDHCLVGEPTATARAGDTIKIGRRGSMNARVTVRGTQGHVAYPHLAPIPMPAMAALVTRLSSRMLDDGTAHFDPSTLAFTTIDAGNAATNVIPAEARAGFNIRFNDQHTPDSLQARIEREAQCRRRTNSAARSTRTSGRAACRSSPSRARSPNCWRTPSQNVDRQARRNYSTTGGTSDARFIKDHCPVAELGLPSGTMHKADECAPVAEIALADRHLQRNPRPPISPIRRDERRAIGVFDSGMGGLTVMRALMARLPQRKLHLSGRHGAAALWHQERRHGDALCHAGGGRAGRRAA